MNSSDPAWVRSQKESTAGPPTTGRATAPSRPSSTCQRDGVRPLRLGVRSRRPVVERGRLLSPAPGEVEPGELAAGCLRQQDHLWADLDALGSGVVAPEAGGRALPEPVGLRVVRGVGALGRVHDDVVVDAEQLRVGPFGRLRTLVLRERGAGGADASAASGESASKSSWTISQSPSCRSFQSLKTHQNQYWSASVPGWSGSVPMRAYTVGGYCGLRSLNQRS